MCIEGTFYENTSTECTEIASDSPVPAQRLLYKHYDTLDKYSG